MTRLPALLALAAFLALAAPASAQMLPSGTWTGTLTDNDGDAHAVSAEIERCAGGFTLALDIDGRTARVPEDAPATWRRGRLTFTTDRVRLPGTLWPRPLVCDLRADDTGTLGGTCTTGDDAVRLDLAPPANASLVCD